MQHQTEGKFYNRCVIIVAPLCFLRRTICLLKMLSSCIFVALTRNKRQCERQGFMLGKELCNEELNMTKVRTATLLIFVITQVDWLTEKMRSNNFTVSAMHGDMPQKERDAIMAEFRSGTTRVLITTDVWARGLDVQQVGLSFLSVCFSRTPTYSTWLNYSLSFYLTTFVFLAGVLGHQL